MKKYKINQVFEDTENFAKPIRVKCVEGVKDPCSSCIYEKVPQSVCDKLECYIDDIIFIETDEPLTTEQL